MKSENSSPEKAYPRKFTNYFIRPKIQIKHALFAMIYSFLGLGLVQIFSYQKLNSLQLTSEIGKESHQWLIEYAQYMFWIHLGTLFLIGIAAFVLSIITTHHFTGPLVPILRHIDALKNKNYEQRTHLRKSDDLTEIAAALNELSESLKKES
jgi:nitrogen fixation/metabolism regulation signal transduction histidine kinase